MMRPRSASVIATLPLLTWTATASAECAWVLWEKTTTFKASPKNVEETQWDPVSTGSTQSICESSKANRVKGTMGQLSSANRPKATITSHHHTDRRLSHVELGRAC